MPSPFKITARVTVDTREITRMQRNFRSAKKKQEQASIWANNYLRFLQARFVVNSAGGKDWSEIKPKTKKKKVYKRWGENAILADSLTLYKALTPTRGFGIVPGQFKKYYPARNRITVGYGTGYTHPLLKSKSKKIRTIAQLASVHQEGNPGRKLPKREIIVPPSRQVLRDTQTIFSKYLRQVVSS